tara:strand:+ start:958 stop:1347 length:390 start_codon:yes stop_codon:yes gene_type:complete
MTIISKIKQRIISLKEKNPEITYSDEIRIILIQELSNLIKPDEFDHWISNFIFENEYSNILSLKKQLSEKECEKLDIHYTYEEIVDILESMENITDLKKKYNSVYLTANNWLKRKSESQTNKKRTWESI